MKLAELYGNIYIGKHLRQSSSPIADDALDGYAFGFQAAYGFGVEFVGFVFDFANG